MIIRLNHHGARAVMDRVPKLHQERMVEYRTARTKSTHDYELPAVAWKQISEMIQEVAFGPKGGRTREHPPSLYTALKHIQAVVSTREHHPALSTWGAAGVQAELIPAWRIPPGFGFGQTVARWSPYPFGWRLRRAYSDLEREKLAEQYKVLMPSVQGLSGHKVTEWYPADLTNTIDPSYSLQLDSHIEFANRT